MFYFLNWNTTIRRKMLFFVENPLKLSNLFCFTLTSLSKSLLTRDERWTKWNKRKRTSEKELTDFLSEMIFYSENVLLGHVWNTGTRVLKKRKMGYISLLGAWNAPLASGGIELNDNVKSYVSQCLNESI